MRTVTRSLAVVAAMTTVAHAQSPEAEALFREAKKLMKQKAFAAACEKFEASERLEASVGTELNLADCREKAGQLASAWAMFIKAAQTAKHGRDRRREAEAKRRTAALESRLAYLTISVPKPARVPGLVVRRNDIEVDAATYGQPVPVDPDDYRITAEAPGHERWQHTISVGNASKTVEIPRLHDAAAPAPAPLPPESPRRREPEAASPWTTRRKAAVALGVLGLAAGGAGVVLGLRANDLESQSDAICATVRCSDSTAIDLNRKARTDGLIANIGMIGGGAMVAGAIALWVFGDARPQDRVSVMPIVGPLGIALGGTY